MDRWRPGRALLALMVPAMLGAELLGAQIAPTLPRDTLFGKLSPEANVPRGVVAPTLPRDTIGGRSLPPSANVPRAVIAPTLPRDTVAAGAASAPDSVRRDSIAPGTTDTAAAPAPRRRLAKPRPRTSRRR